MPSKKKTKALSDIEEPQRKAAASDDEAPTFEDLAGSPEIDADVDSDGEGLDLSLKHTVGAAGPVAIVHARGHRTFPDGSKGPSQMKVLAQVTADELRTFPLVAARHREEFMTPKYGRIASIVFPRGHRPYELPKDLQEFGWMLSELPKGFGQAGKFGLGWKWEYRLVPNAIRRISSITEIVVDDGWDVRVVGHRFILGSWRFDKVRSAIDSIAKRASTRSLEDRQLLVSNEILHAVDPARFKKEFRKPKADEVYQLVQLAGRHPPSKSSKRAVKEMVLQSAAAIAEDGPQKLFELQSIIEQVTLTELISRVSAMLQKPGANENVWQKFFSTNPFVLSLAFALPVMSIRGQAHVGGTRIDGKGQKIADFLQSHPSTGSLALVEIKTPATKLLEADAFRSGTFAPHKQLVQAVAQVLYQRAELVEGFPTLARRNRELADSHVTTVQCVVIAGMAPTALSEKQSFDIYRHSLREVVVVTFDELLEKLRELLRAMKPIEASEQAPDHGVAKTEPGNLGAPASKENSKPKSSGKSRRKTS